MNFRRKLKHLYKNIQRCGTDYVKSNELIKNFREETGMDVGHECIIVDLLKTNIPSRIFSRISKAAKKRGMCVEGKEFYMITMKKIGGMIPNEKYEKFHQIPFVKSVTYRITTVHEEVGKMYVLNGKKIGWQIREKVREISREEKEIVGESEKTY